MTRQEFIEDVNDFWDLKTFCDENGIDICENVYDEDSYNEIIDMDIMEWARDDHWWVLRNRLDDLPACGLGWYYCGDYGWEEADFEQFKDDVLYEMDHHGCWDDDEEEEEEEIEDEEADSEEAFDSDFEDEDEHIFSDEAFFCVLREAV